MVSSGCRPCENNRSIFLVTVCFYHYNETCSIHTLACYYSNGNGNTLPAQTISFSVHGGSWYLKILYARLRSFRTSAYLSQVNNETHEVRRKCTFKESWSTYETFEKCKLNYDTQYSTASWLDCTTSLVAGRKYTTSLECTICIKYCEHINSLRNFSNKWIVGADAFCTSNIMDHHSLQLGPFALNMPSMKVPVLGDNIVKILVD